MEIPVIVERVCYRKEGGFALLAANLNASSEKYHPDMEDTFKELVSQKYGTFTVTTGMLNAHEDPTGAAYVFIGDIVTHNKFGKQLKADYYYSDIPADQGALERFLRTLPNIKEKRSKEILRRFGVEGTINILDNDIEQLLQVTGVNAKRLPSIKKAWDDNKYMRDLYGWLVKYNIDIGLAPKMYERWKLKTMEVLEGDPYKMTELRGVGFIKADAYAHRMITNISIESRTKSCMRYILQEAIGRDSNLCITYGILKRCVLKTISECDSNLGKKTNADRYIKLVPEILKNEKTVFTVVKCKPSGQVFVYLTEVWQKELYIAGSLAGRATLPKMKKKFTPDMIDGAEEAISESEGKEITLDDCQKKAIQSVFEHKITVITGGGGSGKSTICKGIYSIAQKIGASIRMMSPTGKAAQVLSEKTGCPATTIHRGLKLQEGVDLPEESIDEDILLIDEISMSGLDTMYAVMAALEENQFAHIVFVGDKNQLPSVSAGNFLSDMMQADIANVITLEKIHRQDEGSYISLMADHISHGRYVPIPDEATDIKFERLYPTDFNIQVIDYLDEYLKTNDISTLQVISPMKKGNCGVFELNRIIQEKMAKVNGTEELYVERGFSKLYIGDKVIQTKNNYDLDVFNGDMGGIVDMGEAVRDPAESDKISRFLDVSYYGEVLRYWDDDIDQIMLAWAITVHKFQGSQTRDILLVLANEAQIMMSKELVYTAFTRAEKRLDIMGHDQMLRMAPTKSIIRKRYTNMCTIIEGIRTGEKLLQVL